MKSMNGEIKRIVTRVKEAQTQLQGIVKGQNWLEEARKYAERQGKEVKKLFAPDVEKMKQFLEKERKELEKIQKQIPGEVKKLRKFVGFQRKEFEKLLANVRKLSAAQTGKSTGTKKTKTKKAGGTSDTPSRKKAHVAPVVSSVSAGTTSATESATSAN